ncbi:hypothetical protein [Sphingomonas crocodyli]|uniref:Uncharacterized protein n=1 Tax=Sphingomonas crocodyli TaxID=1979270 RepID=A0A437MBC1_9SPHN|nr:hypothetical protein [Sphingomonas crocodyli]RVT94916.1 hypothetical protein EOD43_14240 [Sphingomonas crocodyli]
MTFVQDARRKASSRQGLSSPKVVMVSEKHLLLGSGLQSNRATALQLSKPQKLPSEKKIGRLREKETILLAAQTA